MKAEEVTALVECIMDAAKAQAELSIREHESCGCSWPDSDERDAAWEALESKVNQIFRGIE